MAKAVTRPKMSNQQSFTEEIVLLQKMQLCRSALGILVNDTISMEISCKAHLTAQNMKCNNRYSIGWTARLKSASNNLRIFEGRVFYYDETLTRLKVISIVLWMQASHYTRCRTDQQ
eukprot:scaffold2408_cov94-Cylindrotheca_fusiformis.AAC.2